MAFSPLTGCDLPQVGLMMPHTQIMLRPKSGKLKIGKLVKRPFILQRQPSF
jgi:hypothetical protein